MTSDDESFLSAYMDGQLDADEQHWVESALVSNPRLAEKLRSLISLRGLVAGLSRDAPVDVAPSVMARIKSVSRPRTGFLPALERWRFRSRRLFSPNGILAAAAGLMTVATLFLFQRALVHRADPRTALPPATGLADAPPPAPGTVVTSNDRDRASLSHTDIFRSGSTGTDKTVAGPGARHLAELSDLAASRDLETVRQYLDHPNLRRLFFIKNPRGSQVAQTVASIVEHTTRHGFFKITISQGIVIDPRHPDQATVFALVVTPKDVDRLEDQLKALPGLFEEQPVEPGIATQLADARQVQSLAPAPPPVAEVLHDDLALQTEVAAGADVAGQPAAQSNKAPQNRHPGEPEPPTDEQEQSAPLNSRPEPTKPKAGNGSQESDLASSRAGNAKASQTAKSSFASPVPDDEIVVLVWVYESGPG